MFRLHCHIPAINRPPWIPNDPMAAAGTAGLEAYYSALFSHPALLAQTGHFLDFPQREADSHLPVLYIVPLIGELAEDWQPPILRAEDRLFFDGPLPLELAGKNSLPAWHLLVSLKERLHTDFGEFLIPENLRVALWDRFSPDWQGSGERDGVPFWLFQGQRFLGPVNSAYVDFLLRRDNGRRAWNWRFSLATTLARWLGNDSDFSALPPPEVLALWDQFCAYGFHRWFVQKTAANLEAEPDLQAGDAAMLEAAALLHKGKTSGIRESIGAAYARIRGALDKLTGAEMRVFAEGHHGGMLHEDIGFFEHDWPQHVCDLLEEFLSHPGCKLSLDMPANLFRFYRQRFPNFFRKLTMWIEQGRLEILNGMWGQPLTDSHSLENLLGQFLEGCDELRQLFGRMPEIYATEEYGLGPMMPRILEAAQIPRAVHAVRLGGFSRTNTPARRNWIGPNGGKIEAIEHPDLSEPGLSTGYFLALPSAFATAKRKERRLIALFNIPDFGWNTLFRDEVLTGLQFGNPLFRMATFSELFEILPKQEESVQQRWEDTYHTIFNQYMIRGNMRGYMEKLRQFEYRILSAEAQSLDFPQPWLRSAWRDYLLASSHDYTLVGQGFNGWYGSSVKATYPGPLQLTFSRKIEDVMDETLGAWSRRLATLLQWEENGAFVINQHGFPVESTFFDGQDWRLAELPPHGSAAIGQCPQAAPAFARGLVLRSPNLRCEIDPENGALREVHWKNQSLWAGNTLGLTLPGREISWRNGTVREIDCGLRHTAEFDASDGFQGWIETTYLLAPCSDDLQVEVRLCASVLPERGNYDWASEWKGTFRYAVPNHAGSGPINVCNGGLLIPARPSQRKGGASETYVPDALAHVMSPEVIGVGAPGGVPVWLYNTGFPCYFVYDNRVEQILHLPGELTMQLRFGLGFGNGKLTPVQRSRSLFAPLQRANVARNSLPVCWKNPRIGWMNSSRTGKTLRAWFFNYSEYEETVHFQPNPGICLCPGRGVQTAETLRPFELFYLELEEDAALERLPGSASARQPAISS